MRNFIVSEELFIDVFWESEEAFSKRDAWLYLLMNADENGVCRIGSMRGLAKVWKWSVNKVWRHLQSLQRKGLVKLADRTLVEHPIEHITICDIESYIVSQNTLQNTHRTLLREIKETDKEKATQKEINKENLTKEKYAIAYQKKTDLPLSLSETSSDQCVNKSEEKLNMICEELKAMWNDIMRPTNIPQCTGISPQRKKFIKVRLQEINKLFPKQGPKQVLTEVFHKMARNPYYGGANDRAWKADFGWIFERQDQWLKIYEQPESQPQPSQLIQTTARGQVHQGEYDLTTI